MSNEMEKYPKNMGLEALVAQCLREINAAVRGEAHSEQHWKELMCRATVQHDQAAREALLYHLRRLGRALMGSHPHEEPACHAETKTDYVPMAWEQSRKGRRGQ